MYAGIQKSGFAIWCVRFYNKNLTMESIKDKVLKKLETAKEEALKDESLQKQLLTDRKH